MAPPLVATSVSWNTPARFAWGPPFALGVVDRSTTRPGAHLSGWPMPGAGSAIPGLPPRAADRSRLPAAVQATAARSMLKTPPAPAVVPGEGVTAMSWTAARCGGGRGAGAAPAASASAPGPEPDWCWRPSRRHGQAPPGSVRDRAGEGW